MKATTAKPAGKIISTSKRSTPRGKQIGLRSKPEGESAWERLPFVGKDHHAYFSDWDVPLTGGYFGGIEVGASIARMYLKYLRDEQDNPIRLGASNLQGILNSLDVRVATTKDEGDSLRGQRVGFIYELGNWLEAAATRLGSSFDAIPERSFVHQANEALSRTDAALTNSINSGGAK